jgi:hypothetical protein
MLPLSLAEIAYPKMFGASLALVPGLFFLFFGFIGAGTFLRAAFCGSIALVVFRHGGLPRWLGWTSAIMAAASLVGGLVILTPQEDSILGLVWFVALLAFLAWTLAASIYLTMRPGGIGPRTRAPITMGTADDQNPKATAEDPILRQEGENPAKP